MENLETKIDKLIKDVASVKGTVESLDLEVGKLSASVREVNTTINNLAMSTKHEFDTVREEIKETKEELLNKLATKETVQDHEIRIQKLETNIA